MTKRKYIEEPEKDINEIYTICDDVIKEIINDVIKNFNTSLNP